MKYFVTLFHVFWMELLWNWKQRLVIRSANAHKILLDGNWIHLCVDNTGDCREWKISKLKSKFARDRRWKCNWTPAKKAGGLMLHIWLSQQQADGCCSSTVLLIGHLTVAGIYVEGSKASTGGVGLLPVLTEPPRKDIASLFSSRESLIPALNFLVHIFSFKEMKIDPNPTSNEERTWTLAWVTTNCLQEKLLGGYKTGKGPSDTQ